MSPTILRRFEQMAGSRNESGSAVGVTPLDASASSGSSDFFYCAGRAIKFSVEKEEPQGLGVVFTYQPSLIGKGLRVNKGLVRLL